MLFFQIGCKGTLFIFFTTKFLCFILKKPFKIEYYPEFLYEILKRLNFNVEIQPVNDYLFSKNISSRFIGMYQCLTDDNHPFALKGGLTSSVLGFSSFLFGSIISISFSPSKPSIADPPLPFPPINISGISLTLPFDNSSVIL